MSDVFLPFRRAGVVGLGRSGAAAARLLAGAGIEVRVTEASDSPSLAGVAAELETVKKKIASGEIKVKPTKDDARGGA